MKKIISLSLVLMFSTFVFAQQGATADKTLNEAYKKANAEHKNVFVIFHASWCGWCKKLDASMNDNSTKKYFDESYVVVHLDVQEREGKKNLETPGADVILQKYKGEKAGLPFFLVLNPKGDLLGDSFVNGQNLGCPASAEEVESFKALLKKTSAITNEQSKAVTDRFRQNEAH
jgi:thioredoxin-related protein